MFALFMIEWEFQDQKYRLSNASEYVNLVQPGFSMVIKKQLNPALTKYI